MLALISVTSTMAVLMGAVDIAQRSYLFSVLVCEPLVKRRVPVFIAFSKTDLLMAKDPKSIIPVLESYL